MIPVEPGSYMVKYLPNNPLSGNIMKFDPKFYPKKRKHLKPKNGPLQRNQKLLSAGVPKPKVRKRKKKR